ncbi:MAG: ArsB/NhaD family transporter [Promethearchaeota archaeon]
METSVLQGLVLACFLGVVLVLFFEKKDYLTYSILLTVVAAVATSLVLPGEQAPALEDFIGAIEWDVVFFLICLFAIVEVLEEERVFEEVARRITHRFHANTRAFFYFICLVGTLSAALIEDVSVAVIFIPMMIRACERLRVDPTPFLLGMTISINLAATLTPFGSAQNVLIASEFGLAPVWFLRYLGAYFAVSTVLTLFLLDKLVLSKQIGVLWLPACTDEGGQVVKSPEEFEFVVEDAAASPAAFWRNLAALAGFVLLLFLVPSVIVAGFVGLLAFVFINPKSGELGEDVKKRPRLSHFLRRVDYKLVYFFICLFVLVYCMEVNGTLEAAGQFVTATFPDDPLALAALVLVVTSLLSGVLDNVPVTVVFLPLIGKLVADLGLVGTDAAAVQVAFIIGINVGGNFLPQGSAADMTTLELSRKFCVPGMSFKRLLKAGGAFALLHVALGLGYLALLVRLG